MSTYIRLTDYKDSDSKEQGFFKSENRYEAKQDDFAKIPGIPIAYWLSERVKTLLIKEKPFDDFSNTTAGIMTGNNEKFVKLWTEFELNKLGLNHKKYEDILNFKKKWFPVTRGGEYRKWYGNLESVINLENNGFDIKNSGKDFRLRDPKYYFQLGMTWTVGNSKAFSVREASIGTIFTREGQTSFPHEYFYYLIALLNSKVVISLLQVLSPNDNYSIEHIDKIPTLFPVNITRDYIENISKINIDISKEEWDSRETSWDFTKNELLKHKSDSKIETAYNNYCSYWSEKFYKLHANEEELNRLFIDIYELGDELTPDVALKDITILKSESIINDNNELEFKADEIMKQFISYAVGVMFGRYSIDSDGLVVANLNQDYPKDTTFEIDDDNVIPVLEDDYFSDDIASRIINFVKTTFGAEGLSENINFIEKCLGKTIRAYMVKDFYEDHIKRYKKRPIYWMVSSPKKGFMSLSYMHRYTTDLFARVQNNYLREYITKLEGTIEVQKQTILNEMASNKDKTDADKRIKAIESKLKELISFDRDNLTSFAQNRVDIDLDDGVKVNYNKFKDVLYVIKGLDKE